MSFYDILRTTWERERRDNKLVKLESDFFEKARAYTNHLEIQTNNEPDSLLAELFQKRWIRVNFLLNDLITLRIEKNIREAVNQEKSSNDAPLEEYQFRKSLEELISDFKNTVLGLVQETDVNIDEESEYQLVQFLKSEKMIIVGSDLKNYGPFDINDIVYLPKENARVFIKKSIAKSIKIDS